MNERRDKIIAEANEKASNILRDAKEQADAAIRNINKYGAADADMARLEAERQKLGKKLKGTQEKSIATTSSKKSHRTLKASELHIGDMVRVISMGLTGTVHTLPDSRGELDVQMGIMHSKVKLSDIELVEEASSGKSKKSRVARGAGAYSKASTISPELMLIGMTVDEAVMALDKYIDEPVTSDAGADSSWKGYRSASVCSARSAATKSPRKLLQNRRVWRGGFRSYDSGAVIYIAHFFVQYCGLALH